MKPQASNGQREELGLAGAVVKPPRDRPTFQGLFNGAVCVAFVLLTVACAGLFCRVGQMERELQDLHRACTPPSDGTGTLSTPTASWPDGSAHLPQQNNNNRQVHSVRKRGAASGGSTEAPKRRRHQRDKKSRKEKKRCPKNCKGRKGDVGPQGPPGERGPPGPAGNFSSTFAHFKSGGRQGELESAILNSWSLADWANGEDFHVASSGDITVEKAGIYFIYSQIVYKEKHHLLSYSVYVDGNMYLTCNESVENVTQGVTGRYKTCYVGGLARLEAGAKIRVQGGENMYALLYEDTTYLGLIKVADLPST